MVPRRPAPNSGRRGGGRNGGGGERGMKLRIIEHTDAEGSRSPRGGGAYPGTGGGRKVRNDKAMATGSHVADFLRDRDARQMQNKILMNQY